MLKQKYLNYITVIFAISTIATSIYSAKTKSSPFICIILLIVTVVFNEISRKYNKKLLNLTGKDKKFLNIKTKKEDKK